MQDQNSKLIDTSIDTRDIVYNKGVQKGLELNNQRVDAVQKRLDNSNRNMSDLAKRNDAMSADLSQMGDVLKQNTESNNTTNQSLQKLLRNGFYVHTDNVTKSVAEEFQRITGKSIDSFITDATRQEIQRERVEVNQASRDNQLLANASEKATRENIAAVNSLAGFINVWLAEFAIILGTTISTPGLWRYLVLIATTAVAVLFNEHQN